MPLRGWRRAGQVTSATWWEWTGWARPKPCGLTAPTPWSATSPSWWTARDRAVRLRGRALGATRDRARPRHARADGVGVRPRQRAHRPAGEPGRGRALRAARDLPQWLLRGAALSLCRGGIRLPRGGPEHGQRDQRKDSPVAGGRRALRRPLWRAAQARTGAGPPG